MSVLAAVNFAEWFERQHGAVQAAVITGTVALVSLLVTAIVSVTNIRLKARLDGRAERQKSRGAQRELYRRYADPLTSAAESLYWRLNEVFEGGGGYYLKADGGRTRFERYKVDSTHYRVAALLGWMEGLRRELVLSAAQPDSSVDAMREAVLAVRQALADGRRVEQELVERLADLWRLQAPADERFGRELHGTQKQFLHEAGKASIDELSRRAQRRMLLVLAEQYRRAGAGSVNPKLVRLLADAALQVMAVREAWIFRDWQEAIGGWMLVETTAARRFDVRDFAGSRIRARWRPTMGTGASGSAT